MHFYLCAKEINMSHRALRIASIANHLYITDVQKAKEAGLLDKIVKMVPGLDKVAPKWVDQATKSDLADELLKKAQNVGEFLGASKIGAHVKIPAKRPAELTNMNSKSIISAIDHMKNVFSEILSGETAKKFKTDNKMKNEASKILKIAKEMDEIKKGIKELQKDLYKQFGAVEKESVDWETEDKRENQRAIAQAEKEIKKYLGQVYAALFGPAISEHKWGYGVRVKPASSVVAYEEGITESLEGEDEDSEGVTTELGSHHE